jgi:hypothetical protein
LLHFHEILSNFNVYFHTHILFFYHDCFYFYLFYYVNFTGCKENKLINKEIKMSLNYLLSLVYRYIYPSFMQRTSMYNFYFQGADAQMIHFWCRRLIGCKQELNCFCMVIFNGEFFLSEMVKTDKYYKSIKNLDQFDRSLSKRYLLIVVHTKYLHCIVQLNVTTSKLHWKMST